MQANPDGPFLAGTPYICSGTDATRWDVGTASLAFPGNFTPGSPLPNLAGNVEEGTGMFNLDAMRVDGNTTISAGPGCYWFNTIYFSLDLELYSDAQCVACLACGAPAYCFGDGSTATACPCGNFGAPGAGCNNSLGNGGASLSSNGLASISNDSVWMMQTNELSTALSIFLQGTSNLPSGVVFGDGVRCVGGSLKRLAAGFVVARGPSCCESADLTRASITPRETASRLILGCRVSRRSHRVPPPRLIVWLRSQGRHGITPML
jgi:hypothetical protein